MIPCVCCEALYSDEEAERLANESERSFNAQQLALIEQNMAEEDDL